MKQLLPTPGYKVRFAVRLKVRRPAGRKALFSVKSATANSHQNYNNKKAAGPERPASAAGIGPFGLRYASRALRARQRPS